MATELQQLETRRDAVLAEIAAFGAATSALSSKPSYSVEGQSFDWNGARVSITAYRKGLYEELQMIREQIAIAEGDWEVQDVIR